MIGLARLLSGTSTAFSRGSKGLSIHLHCTYQLATTETNKISAKNSDSVDVTMMYEMLCKHSRTFRDCTLLFQMATKKTYSKTDVMHEPSKFKQNAYIQPKQMDNTPSLLHPLPNPLSFPTPLFSLLPPSLPPPSLPPFPHKPILPRGWFCGTDAGITTALKWKGLLCSVRPEKRMKRQPCIIRTLKINESLSAGEAGRMFCSLK